MFTEVFRAELNRLHETLVAGVSDLTSDEWHVVPAGHVSLNTIGFEFWHFVRTEDNIVRHLLQDRRLPVWREGGWDERLGLPKNAQGTGMSIEEAHALRINDIPAFLEYTRQVWASTNEYLDRVTAEDLTPVIAVPPLGDLTKAGALARPVLAHGFTHLGQLETMRTLLGKGSTMGI